MIRLPLDEARRRSADLQARLNAASPPLAAVILVQNVDVFYFTGTLQTCHLIIPAAGEPRLLVRKVLARARDDSPLTDVRPMASLRELTGHLRELCGAPPWRVGFEFDVLPAKSLQTYRELLGSQAHLTDASELVLEVRSVKSEWELERIREASRVIARVFRDLPQFLAEDLSTYELQAILDCRARTAGHPGVIRMRGLNVECSLGIVVSGPTGALPSHSFFPIGGRGIDRSAPAGGDFEKIGRDLPIILDYLGCSAGYYADQSRMAVKGRLYGGPRKIYEAMQEVLRHCERTIRAGSVPARVYSEVLALVEARGLGEGFMGLRDHAVGFIGHSVGLEVNESPVLAPKFERPLPAGTVLAIEPKFTHPDLGVVGIENTYVVRADKLENLTPIPEDIITV
jgi:Xaa-Pro aminopeptidase